MFNEGNTCRWIECWSSKCLRSFRQRAFHCDLWGCFSCQLILISFDSDFHTFSSIKCRYSNRLGELCEHFTSNSSCWLEDLSLCIGNMKTPVEAFCLFGSVLKRNLFGNYLWIRLCEQQYFTPKRFRYAKKSNRLLVTIKNLKWNRLKKFSVECFGTDRENLNYQIKRLERKEMRWNRDRGDRNSSWLKLHV